jgi:aspartate beta-hydroxylase
MTTSPSSPDLDRRLDEARRLDRSGQALQAVSLYSVILRDSPDNIEAAVRIAQFASHSGQVGRALELLEDIVKRHPANSQLSLELAIAHANAGNLPTGIRVLESTLATDPGFYNGWLLLGELLDATGNDAKALWARFEAVTRAKRDGAWNSEGTTSRELLGPVTRAIEQVRTRRREIFYAAYDDLRHAHGANALKRVDKALAGYLREWDATPPDPRQRPKFLFFPDIPCPPYHDPFLQPWARRLEDAFPILREDALRMLDEDKQLPNFVDFKEGDPIENVLTGDGPRPSWEAFFFYRHGKRYDKNHERCPRTSELLESIELCRIADEAPEILFSVLTPGTHIQPHYGVTNTRLVMHLPLVVPPDCALNLIDAGEHHWKEGELVMFDDTFKHEAWNRSSSTRIILLMDCWNPHLTDVEKVAVKKMIETISALHLSEKPRSARVGG